MLRQQTLVAWVDMLHLLVIALIMIVVVAVAAIQPPKPEAARTAPGTLSFYISWPSDRAADVDMWIRPPGDAPVNYTRKNGINLDLLRDDRGDLYDSTGQNFEIAFTRGLIPGDYVFNAVLFANDASGAPVPVRAVIAIRTPAGIETELWHGDVTLVRVGGEKTFLRFHLDERGSITMSDTIPVTLQ